MAVVKKLTGSQQNAVFSTGKSLLVSAGAGSGKTHVLTQRLTEMLKNGATLDDFLVVTFTVAAAADLKDKLYDALSAAIAAGNNNSKALSEQLFLLSGARISTIHSFCYDLVKHNFSALGISPECSIADEADADTLLSETIEDMFSDMFSAENSDIILLQNCICQSTREDELAKIITDVYTKLRAFYRYDEWLSDCAEYYRQEANKASIDLFATECGTVIREKVKNDVNEHLKDAEELVEFFAQYGAKYIKKPQSCLDILREAVNADLYEKMYGAFCGKVAKAESESDFTDLPKDSWQYYKSTCDRLGTFITDAKKSLFYDTKDFESMFNECATVINALYNVISELDKRFFAAKSKKSLLDFADLEQLTVRLLENGDGSESEICKALKTKLKQVFIDEYQDVNPLQDRIFSLLSRRDDRFMVGDIKQSIYKFRNAYPSIFKGYKQSFADASDGKSDVIFLRENFRCAKNVIDFTNLVTSFASSGSEMEAEYKNEELVFAREDGDETNKVTVATALYGQKQKKDAVWHCADYIASEIKQLAKKGIPYGKIAVLFSKIKGASAPYEHALAKAGVPYKVMKSAGFLEKPEVTMALACLAAVDNPTDDVALFSMMRSPMFDFTADELYTIRKSNKAYSFITCVRIFASGKHLKKAHLTNKKYRKKLVMPIRTKLVTKARHFMRLLDDYRLLACGMQTHKFLWHIYETSGLLAIASAEGPHQRANLLKLYQDASAFESHGFKGISAFRAYIDRLTEEQAGIKGAQLEDTDCVKLMTVHASKGLEFKCCFIANTDSKFNISDDKSSFMIGYKSGITFTLFYPDERIKRDTPSRRVAALAASNESKAEELRKLYVAMTRAMDKLYIVGCVPEDEADAVCQQDKADCHLDWVLGAIANKDLPYIERVNITDQPAVYGTLDSSSDEVAETLPECDFSFVYPHAAATKIPAKISVSQLRLGLLEEQEYGEREVTHAVPMFAVNEASAGQKGTANHQFMQFCDMANAAEKGSRAEADRLLSKRFIDKKQYDMLDFAALDAFFAGELYKEIKASKKVEREKRFSILDNASLIGGPKDEQILVQGVIDCFYTDKDGIVVVDYKTDRVYGADAEAKLIERHKVQLRYYCTAAAAMTGLKVSRALLYSFSLGRAVEVPIV